MKRFLTLLATVGAWCFIAAAAHAERPVVMELYTSQGCSSCPAADVLLKKIATDPSLLPLSFHVTFFDSPQWKDPYATPANTERQKEYNKKAGEAPYTPQMVIDGHIIAVGADGRAIASALTYARKNPGTEIPLSITPNAASDGLDVRVGDDAHPVPPSDVTLYEVHFNRTTITPISGGENSGITVENTNNVIGFFPITPSPQYFVPFSSFAEDGIAYILQSTKGPVLGAAYYMRPK